jgi:hypothetical protein
MADGKEEAAWAPVGPYSPCQSKSRVSSRPSAARQSHRPDRRLKKEREKKGNKSPPSVDLRYIFSQGSAPFVAHRRCGLQPTLHILPILRPKGGIPPKTAMVRFPMRRQYSPTLVLLLAWYVDEDATRASNELRRPCESHRQASCSDSKGPHKGVVMLYSIPSSSNRELAGLWICKCDGGVFSEPRRTTLTIIQGLYCTP